MSIASPQSESDHLRFDVCGTVCGLAPVFRRVDLELYETTREDVDAHPNFFVPSPRLDSKVMRVLVRETDRF